MKKGERRKKMEPINSTFSQKPPQYVYDVFIKDTTEIEKGRNLSSLVSGNILDVALDDLRSKDFSLRTGRCIPLTLQYQDLTYVFIQEKLNLFGEARTLDEAEKEIGNEIVKLYKRLNVLPSEQLGPYPKELLKFLEDYIA